MKHHFAKDFLPLIKAWSEGKKIQYRNSPENAWIDCLDNVEFSRDPCLYRIKPEPRTQDVYVYFYPDGTTSVHKVTGPYNGSNTFVVKLTAVCPE